MQRQENDGNTIGRALADGQSLAFDFDLGTDTVSARECKGVRIRVRTSSQYRIPQPVLCIEGGSGPIARNEVGIRIEKG